MAKRVALVLLIGVAIIAGAASWVWSEATALPNWYEDDPIIEPEGPSAPRPPAAWSVVPEVSRETRTTRAPEPRADPPRRREMRGFHWRAVARDRAFRRAVRASKAVYREGHLEIGVVIDTGHVPVDKLRPEARKLFRRALRAFPGNEDRKVYVGLEDRPVTREGFLQLGSSPKVRIGNLRYPLSKVARQLGLSKRRLRTEINRAFRRLKVTDPTAKNRSQ